MTGIMCQNEQKGVKLSENLLFDQFPGQPDHDMDHVTWNQTPE